MVSYSKTDIPGLGRKSLTMGLRARTQAGLSRPGMTGFFFRDKDTDEELGLATPVALGAFRLPSFNLYDFILSLYGQHNYILYTSVSYADGKDVCMLTMDE